MFAKAPSGQRQVISRHRKKAKCDCSRVRRKAERKWSERQVGAQVPHSRALSFKIIVPSRPGRGKHPDLYLQHLISSSLGKPFPARAP